MSTKYLISIIVVVGIGILGFIFFFTLGRGTVVYVRGEAALARDRGEHLLNKRRHTTNRVKRAEYLTQAIEQFRKAIELKPDFEVAYNMLGHSYIERGQWEHALKNLDQALQLRAEYPAALYNRARVYQYLSVSKRDNSYIDRAIQDYREALKSDLSANIKGDLYKALADAFHQKGEFKEAIDQLTTYLKRAPHAQDAMFIRRKIRGLQLMEKGAAPPLTAPLN